MRPWTILPTKAAIVAFAITSLIPQSIAFTLNFVYNDLLAHPQYDVDFLKEVIPASTVSNRHNSHRRKSGLKQPQIEMTEKGAQDQRQGTVLESPSTMVMTDAEGMRWSCVIPPKMVHEVKAAPKLSQQEIEEEDRRSVRSGLELLDHLTGQCLQQKRDYWTYEYCHKKSIRQYHVAQLNGQWVPDPNELIYTLALYDPKPANIQDQTNNEAALQQRPLSSAPPTTELEVNNERKYLVQRWENGDICDLTGLSRKVEVQFHCAPYDDRIQFVTEPSTCNYIMVIYSPNLCKDPAFESIPAPDANKIECRRIVTDEQYQKLKAASIRQAIEGPDTDAGIVVQDPHITIGQVPRAEQERVDAMKYQPSVLNWFGDIVKLAQQINEINSQTQLEEIMGQYEALAGSIKSMMAPEYRDVYEKLEDMIQRLGNDNRDIMAEEARVKAQEKEAAAPAREAREAIEAIFGDGGKKTGIAKKKSEGLITFKLQDGNFERAIDLETFVKMLGTITDDKEEPKAAQDQEQVQEKKETKEKNDEAQTRL
ncbi:Protein OS-9 [Linnemannia zychae]|nr:Protein OS-9 [Linnemannia zychae]